MDDTDKLTANIASYLYEKATPFSKSKIWQLNREYYQENGIKAWSEGMVPQHITSNARVGKYYAEVIYAFLKDLASKGEINETVHIIELGAGHGRLAFYILKELDKIIKFQTKRLPLFRYVISDIGLENLEFFKSHPMFQEYIERGILDVAFFDATVSQQIELHFAKQTIKKGSLDQPIIAIGNYFFDSIPCDLFYLKKGEVWPCLVAIESTKDPIEVEVNDLMANLNLKFSLGNQLQSYYQDPRKETILKNYQSQLENTFLLYPNEGIDCIERLRILSKKGLVFISLDKGNCEVSSLDNTPAPDMVRHGSFSFSVNFHSLGEHCKSSGGTVWFPELSAVQLQMVFLMYLEDGENYLNTCQSFDRLVNDFGPDDLDNVKNFMYDNLENSSINDIIGLLRLFDYDHLIFQRMINRIKHLITNISYEERKRIAIVLEKVWETYFKVDENYDLSFEIGGLLYQLGYFGKALIYFAHSEKIFGFTADGFYNRMICYYQLREDEMLKSTLAKAKNMFPAYDNFSSIENLDLESK